MSTIKNLQSVAAGQVVACSHQGQGTAGVPDQEEGRQLLVGTAVGIVPRRVVDIVLRPVGTHPVVVDTVPEGVDTGLALVVDIVLVEVDKDLRKTIIIACC